MSRTCRSCGAPIVWAVTTSGKRMPVDALPHDDGNVVLRRKPRVVEAHVLGPLDVELRKEKRKGRPGGLMLHRSHFATCPNADSHRRSA